MIGYHKITTWLLVLLFTHVAQAQQQSGPQPTLEGLQQEVQELRQQIAALEAKLATQATASTEAPHESSIQDSNAPEPQSWLNRETERLSFRGFGEVNYKALDQRQPEIASGGFVPGSAANFYAGNFDLLLTAPIGVRAHVLSEIDFQETDAQQFKLDVDRLMLSYDLRDWLQPSAGRYQTAIGYYNTTFMSSAWPQTTVDRPLLMAFPDEGGVLPLQAIGLSVQGSVPLRKLGLNYLFEYGSSDTIRTRLDGIGSQDDENNGNQVNLGIFARPDRVPGLEIGGSIYHDKISDDRNVSIRYGQTIVNVHVVYVARGVELLNEGVLIRHAELNGPNLFNMPGGYTLVSKQFGKFRPFFRFQYLNMNPQSTLHDVLLRYGPTFGMRYDFNAKIAIKLQLDHAARKSQSDLNGVQTQLAFAF